MRDRKGPNEDCVHEAVDRCVGSDAECEREDGHECKELVRAHGAQCEANILRELFPESGSPHASRVLLDQCDIAELPEVVFHCQVVLKFLFEFALELSAVKDEAQPAQELFHIASITREMAVITRSNSRSSRASCFLPAGVRL